MQPKQLQRFLNEAQAAAHLHHANIVPVFAVGSDRGVHYYAMQFIDGMSLAEMLAQLRRNAGWSDDGESHTRTVLDSSSVSSPRKSNELRRDDPPPLPPPRVAPGTMNQLSVQVSTLKSRESGEYFRTIAGWICQAAQGLAYAHDLGIATSSRPI